MTVSTSSTPGEQTISEAPKKTKFKQFVKTSVLTLAFAGATAGILALKSDNLLSKQRPLRDPVGNLVNDSNGKIIWTYPVLGPDGQPRKTAGGDILFATPEEGGVKPAKKQEAVAKDNGHNL